MGMNSCQSVVTYLWEGVPELHSSMYFCGEVVWEIEFFFFLIHFEEVKTVTAAFDLFGWLDQEDQSRS